MAAIFIIPVILCEIDTKEDQQEIDDFVSLITEFKDKLIA